MDSASNNTQRKTQGLFKNISKIQISTLYLILFLLFTAPIMCAEEVPEDTTDIEVFHEEFEMSKGEGLQAQIQISDIYQKFPSLDTSRHLIVINVQSTIIDRTGSSLQHLIDVSTSISNEKEEVVDIKDVIFKEEEEDIILHYIAYDLCNMKNNTYINVNIEATEGKIGGFIMAEIKELSPFAIECTSPNSELFKPREQHGACETWDGSVWVFGGEQTVDKETNLLDDISHYDSKNKIWKTIKPKSMFNPPARFGHSQICYFNYIIIFGGQGANGEILGDLWVFDITHELWRFIMNTADTHEIGRKGVQGIVPSPRMFSATTVNTDMGAGFLSGGIYEEGVACDLWALDLDGIISFIGDIKNQITNFWVKRDFSREEEVLLCRSGHSVDLLDPNTVLIFGGFDEGKKYVKESLSYDIGRRKLTVLEVLGEDKPSPRRSPGTLSTGNGMVILYGGADIYGEGYFPDLWHITVRTNKIHFRKIKSPKADDQMYVNWRYGFTMHYVRNIRDPIIIGGTYGNNQQSRALFILPEIKCANSSQFADGGCTPCPRGSVLQGNSCKWCSHNQYFEENRNDYFGSVCLDCPRGLVGGSYRACVPCEGGFIYDLTHHNFCRQCEEDKICPVGTKYEFPAESLSKSFEEVKIETLPDFYNPHQIQSDNTATYVIFLSVGATLALFICMALILSMCKEKALFVFREMDKTFITGGKVKSVVGGVIICFFLMISLIISGGFIMNYTIHNSQITTSETKNPFLNRDMQTSYLFNITLYTSRFIDSEEPFKMDMDNYQNISETPLVDLCEKNRIQYTTDRYFSMIKGKNTKFNCVRELLSNDTEAYHLSLLIKHVEDEAPEYAYVRFVVDSDYTQVFHFFEWEYWNIWGLYEHIPVAYSKVSGVVTPDKTSKSNHNITTAFRGPESTKIFFELTPTYYSSEVDDQNYEGYQIFVEEYQRGSTVNKRNMGNQMIPTGGKSQGFELEMVSTVGDKVQHVQVHKIRSIIEIIAYIFGFLAGLVLVAHVIKHFLSKEEYFKGLDRECDTLFGSLTGGTLEAQPYSRPGMNSERELRNFEYKNSQVAPEEEDDKDIQEVKE